MQNQNAVVAFSHDFFGIDRFAYLKGSAIISHTVFAQQIFAFFVAFFDVGVDTQGAVFEVDVNVFSVNSRDVGAKNQLVGFFDDIHVGPKVASAPRVLD